MATNPMQRKARNSFLLGMLVTLLIAGVIIAFLVIQLKNKIDKEKAEKAASVNVYVINQDVSSGQVITEDMLSLQAVNKNLVPNNATSNMAIIENYKLQDKEGNNIYSKTDNNQIKLYITKNNKEYEVQQEEETENYYITKNNDKEYLELDSVPLVAKVTMKKNTVITTELLSKGDNIVQDDMRKQEYNMIVLPTDLKTGDYVDIRVMMPNGQDFIVVSKKEVEVPLINGVESDDTIWMNLSEEEILHMSCAIVDSAQVKAAKIYATKYTEAGMQNAATPTYPINGSTSKLLQNDPNILEKSMNEMRARYSDTDSSGLRDNINGTISGQGDQAQSNLETTLEESITNSKNSRKQYLESLSGGSGTEE